MRPGRGRCAPVGTAGLHGPAHLGGLTMKATKTSGANGNAKAKADKPGMIHGLKASPQVREALRRYADATHGVGEWGSVCLLVQNPDGSVREMTNVDPQWRKREIRAAWRNSLRHIVARGRKAKRS